MVISKHYLLLWYWEAISDLVPIPVCRQLFRHLRQPLPPSPTALETLPEPLPQATEPMPPAEPEHPSALLPGVGQHQQVVADGMVYVSVFNPLDGCKNWHHLITAFYWAFRDTSDTTLVSKMARSDLTAYHIELFTLLSQPSPFVCRVIALYGYLDAAEYARLHGAASYCVNASRYGGLCLPLMEFMPCGTLVAVPDHSVVVDYMNAQVGFVVRSNQEPAAWPQDSRRLYSIRRCWPSWESLKEVCLESYRVAQEQPERYRQLSAAANQHMRGYCVGDMVRQRPEPFPSARKTAPAPGIELAATIIGSAPC